ncbi:cell wall hydrolase [Frisingicoccus sp.]|uniref:cell wall hydrolase n=1 Tax=Frisingicoccus sp. TaxID=1918627 RepID=UPI00386A378B
MGKKFKGIILHMISAVIIISHLVSSSVTVFAEETPETESVCVVNDASISPNQEKLVSQKTPYMGFLNLTLNHTDVLNDFFNTSHLFYNGFFADKFVVNTEPYLEIYSESNGDSEVTGKIYPASYGTVDEVGEEWTKITSGDVTGYIATKDIYTGFEAEQLARSLGGYKAVVCVESINIREKADINSKVIGTAVEDEGFSVIESGKEWIKIAYGEAEGYVAAPYVKQMFRMDEAEPILPEPTVSVSSDEEYLLACMVYVESGGESYEGQLAVANVILNRVRDPRFGNTVADVVYAAGQFPGAHNGALANVLANGPSASCMQAAREALAGVNNIGDYYYFNGYVDTSCVSSYTVIGGHTFYNY